MWEQRKLKFDIHVTTAWCILYLLCQYELSYENENMFVIIHSGLSISCTWNLPSTWSARMNLNMRYLRTIARAPELVHSSLWFCIHREDSKQFFIYSTQIDLFFFRIWFDFFSPWKTFCWSNFQSFAISNFRLLFEQTLLDCVLTFYLFFFSNTEKDNNHKRNGIDYTGNVQAMKSITSS